MVDPFTLSVNVRVSGNVGGANDLRCSADLERGSLRGCIRCTIAGSGANRLTSRWAHSPTTFSASGHSSRTAAGNLPKQWHLRRVHIYCVIESDWTHDYIYIYIYYKPDRGSPLTFRMSRRKKVNRGSSSSATLSLHTRVWLLLYYDVIQWEAYYDII